MKPLGEQRPGVRRGWDRKHPPTVVPWLTGSSIPHAIEVAAATVALAETCTLDHDPGDEDRR